MKNNYFIVFFISLSSLFSLMAEEGVVRKLIFSGLPDGVDKEVLTKDFLNKEGNKYRDGFTAWDCCRATKLLQDDGYFDAVIVAKAKVDNNMTSIDYAVSAGKRYYFGIIKIDGFHVADITEIKKKSGINDNEKTPVTRMTRELLESEVNKIGGKGRKKYTLNTTIHVDGSGAVQDFAFKEE